MRLTRTIDCLINILLPLMLGLLIYAVDSGAAWFRIIKNYIPDLLWAYALFSALLITWQRQWQWVWLVAAMLLALAYEWLQHLHWVAGTADLLDLAAYAAGFLLAAQANHFLKPKPKLYEA